MTPRVPSVAGRLHAARSRAVTRGGQGFAPASCMRALCAQALGAVAVCFVALRVAAPAPEADDVGPLPVTERSSAPTQPDCAVGSDAHVVASRCVGDHAAACLACASRTRRRGP